MILTFVLAWKNVVFFFKPLHILKKRSRNTSCTDSNSSVLGVFRRLWSRPPSQIFSITAGGSFKILYAEVFWHGRGSNTNKMRLISSKTRPPHRLQSLNLCECGCSRTHQCAVRKQTCVIDEWSDLETAGQTFFSFAPFKQKQYFCPGTFSAAQHSNV